MGQLEHYYRTQLLGATAEKDTSESGPDLAKAMNESMPANFLQPHSLSIHSSRQIIRSAGSIIFTLCSMFRVPTSSRPAPPSQQGEPGIDECFFSSGYPDRDDWLRSHPFRRKHEFGSPTYVSFTMATSSSSRAKLVSRWRYVRRLGHPGLTWGLCS